MTRPMCRHCGMEKVTRPRGLGWKCYYTPGVRDLYPVSQKPCMRRASPDRFGSRPLPRRPTQAPPGSPAKVAVLEQRAARGECLWHPDDATDWTVPASVVRRLKQTRKYG